MSRQTKGPWEAQSVQTEEATANAQLRAAALDLLAALTISQGQWIHSVNKDQCLAAIAKATGTEQ